jgi:hypothetical protein
MRPLRERVRALGRRAVDAAWEDFADAPWLEDLVVREERERARLGLERRTKRSRLGKFKPMADFDWSWPSTLARTGPQMLAKTGPQS